MADVSIQNTTAGITAKTIDLLESDQTITGLKTFDRDPSAPFAVSSGSAVVTNLDADKLDGQEGTYYLDTRNHTNLATMQTTSLTGTQNNFDLDGNYTILRCSNASALTFTGMTVNGATPNDGDRVIIIAANSTVKMANDNSGSTVGNRFGHPQSAGQILGLNGIAEYIYVETDNAWRPLAVEPGAPISVAFAAGNFTASAGTWTVESGDQLTFTYQQRGTTVRFAILINTSTVSGVTTGQLRIAMPNGFVAAAEEHIGVLIYNNNSQELFEALVSNGATNITISPAGGSVGAGAWTNSTNLMSLRFIMEIQVQ
jgi:hypothetical protein